MPPKAPENVEELLLAVSSAGVAIALRERKPNDQLDVKWVAATGNSPDAMAVRQRRD